MKRTESGLFVAHNFSFLRFRHRKRTVTLPNGERAKITIDDSGTVKQIEHGDHLDALVRPAAIHLVLRPTRAGPAAGGFRKPDTIRTRTTVRK